MLIATATPAELVAMLRAPYTRTVELALFEMERRFDPAHPDWSLLDELLASDRPEARQIGESWRSVKRLDGGLAAQPWNRRFAVKPDVFEFVFCHSISGILRSLDTRLSVFS